MRYRTAILVGLVALGCLVAGAVALDLTMGWSRWGSYIPEGSDRPAPAANQHPTMQLRSPALASGEVAEVSIILQNIPDDGLASFDIEIGFDKSAIKVQEVLPGDQPWTDNSAVVSNRRGLVMLSNAKAEARSGTFLLARLKVEALAEAPQSAEFSLNSAVFRTPGQGRIPVSLVDEDIQIASPAPVPPADTPFISPESSPESDEGTPGQDSPENYRGETPPEDPEGDTPGGPATTPGWLYVEGNQILDQSGRPVVFRGVNIENREWVWHFDRSISFEMRAVAEATAPPPDGWGANIIILAVASGPINRNDDTYLGYLDQLVDKARSNGAYTLLVYRYPEPNNSQPTMPDQAAEDAMAALAARYADEPAVIYALQAEPHDVSWGRLKPRFTSMIDAIRAEAPKALIVVPGTDWGRYVHWALEDPIPRENLVYKIHYYDSFDLANSRYKISEIAAEYPLLIGEFGTGSRMGLSDVNQLLDLSESLGVSWAAWLFHDKACPCMLSDASDFSTTPFGTEIRRRLQANAIERLPSATRPDPGPAAALTPSNGREPGTDTRVSATPPAAQVFPGDTAQLAADGGAPPD